MEVSETGGLLVSGPGDAHHPLTVPPQGQPLSPGQHRSPGQVTEQPALSWGLQKEVSLFHSFLPAGTQMLPCSSPGSSLLPREPSPGERVRAGLDRRSWLPPHAPCRAPSLWYYSAGQDVGGAQNPQGDNPRQIPADHSGITSRGTGHVHVKAQPRPIPKHMAPCPPPLSPRRT